MADAVIPTWSCRATRPSRRCAIALALLSAVGLLRPSNARGEPASQPWKNPFGLLSFGAGLGAAQGPKSSVHGIAEITLVYDDGDFKLERVYGPHLSLGASFAEGAMYAYSEIAWYYFVSLGAGAGYRSAEAESGLRSGLAYHLLVALPIPLIMKGWRDVGMPYVEPYYRPQIGWAGRGTVHEMGLMFRLMFATPGSK